MPSFPLNPPIGVPGLPDVGASHQAASQTQGAELGLRRPGGEPRIPGEPFALQPLRIPALDELLRHPVPNASDLIALQASPALSAILSACSAGFPPQAPARRDRTPVTTIHASPTPVRVDALAICMESLVAAMVARRQHRAAHSVATRFLVDAYRAVDGAPAPLQRASAKSAEAVDRLHETSRAALQKADEDVARSLATFHNLSGILPPELRSELQHGIEQIVRKNSHHELATEALFDGNDLSAEERESDAWWDVARLQAKLLSDCNVTALSAAVRARIPATAQAGPIVAEPTAIEAQRLHVNILSLISTLQSRDACHMRGDQTPQGVAALMDQAVLEDQGRQKSLELERLMRKILPDQAARKLRGELESYEMHRAFFRAAVDRLRRAQATGRGQGELRRELGWNEASVASIEKELVRDWSVEALTALIESARLRPLQ